MRKTGILIGIIMLLFTTYQISSTYAKYTSSASATAQKQAGAWVIKANNTNISSASSVTNFTIDSLTYPSSSFVAPNKIAPGSSGYFDILIDPTGSSVAIRYDVSLDVSGLNTLDAISLTSACTVVNGTEVTTGIVATGTGTYSGTISLNDVQNGVPCRARFYVTWQERGTEAGDVSDSSLGSVLNSTTAIPVTIVVSQYSGEALN